MRPADQHLRGAQRPDTRDLQQPRSDCADQDGALGLELVGLGLQELDTLGGGPQRADGGAVLQRPGRPVPQARAGGDLSGCAAAAQLGAQLLRGTHDQGLELADCSDTGKGRAASGGQQGPSCFPLATPAWDRHAPMVVAQRLAGGPDGVQRVALGTAASGWPPGSADLHDPLAVLVQPHRQAGPQAAGALDRPAAAAGHLRATQGKQPLVAGRVGAGGGLGQHATQVGDGGGGQGAWVGVDADGRVDLLCQHGHAVVSLVWGGRGRRRPCRSHRAAQP
jgi:hypothetical protein